MRQNQTWVKTTTLLLLFATTLSGTLPLTVASEVHAQRPPSYPYYQDVIPAGTIIPVDYEKQKIVVSPKESVSLTLIVDQDVFHPNGRLLIPAGSKILGKIQPTPNGSQFIAEKLVIRNRRQYRFYAESQVINNREKVSGGVNSDSVAKGAAIGAAAATAISAITGDKAIATEEVLGGAGLGALAGVFVNRKQTEVIVIYPQEDLELRVTNNIPLR